ncbi:hypothetical protein HYW43_02125 [Candidatus Daviesbacteria bacterium]|nr:hypothetical protein [Candidatus Daviesbacteria bacterium]
MHFDYAQCKQKGSAVLLLLVGLLIIGITGFFIFRPAKLLPQESKAPVKTTAPLLQSPVYTNQSLGFEFKYSKELTVKEDSEEEFNKRGNGDYRKNFKGYVGYEPGLLLGAVAVLDQNNTFDKSPLSVWVFENPDNLSVDKWFDKYWYYPFVWGVFDYTSKGHIVMDQEATISGQLAKYKIVSYQPGSPKLMYIAKNQKMYLFRIIGEDGDKILSTLKFLK